MPPKKLLPLALLLVTGMATLAPLPRAAVGEDDPASEARLLVLEGKFTKAEQVLTEAPGEVRNDPALRRELGDLAMRWSGNQVGESRRAGLVAARGHYELAVETTKDDSAAALGAVKACFELIELELVDPKKTSEVRQHLNWAVDLGKVALSRGQKGPEFMALLGEARGRRAATMSSAAQADQVAEDYETGADLLARAAKGHKNAAEWLGRAAAFRLAEARFINDKIPIPKETRDEESLKAAIGYATEACKVKNVSQEAYDAQLQALRLAGQWGMTEEVDEPIMQALAPAVEGLELMVPRARGWQQQREKGEWDVLLYRNFEGESKYIQLMVKRWSWEEFLYGQSWQGIEVICKRKHEGQREGFDPVSREIEPMNLAKKKKDPDVWHFRIAGFRKSDGKQIQQAEWYWQDDKAKVSYQLRILDYDAPWGLDEPDVVAFVKSAVGSAPPQEDEGKKGKKKRKKKKK